MSGRKSPSTGIRLPGSPAGSNRPLLLLLMTTTARPTELILACRCFLPLPLSPIHLRSHRWPPAPTALPMQRRRRHARLRHLRRLPTFLHPHPKHHPRASRPLGSVHLTPAPPLPSLLPPGRRPRWRSAHPLRTHRFRPDPPPTIRFRPTRMMINPFRSSCPARRPTLQTPALRLQARPLPPRRRSHRSALLALAKV